MKILLYRSLKRSVQPSIGFGLNSWSSIVCLPVRVLNDVSNVACLGGCGFEGLLEGGSWGGVGGRLRYSVLLYISVLFSVDQPEYRFIFSMVVFFSGAYTEW